MSINSTEVQKHLDESINRVRSIFLKAVDRIEAIKPGEKIPATELAAELAKDFDTTGPNLYPVLKMLTDGYPGVVIKRGAHGGIHRPALVTKPVVVIDTNDAIIVNSDSNSKA